jgi:hypothetical protein
MQKLSSGCSRKTSRGLSRCQILDVELGISALRDAEICLAARVAGTGRNLPALGIQDAANRGEKRLTVGLRRFGHAARV